MLRHACGYALANRGHDTRALQAYLGHRNSTRYATQKCRLPALRTFGGPNPHLEAWISPKKSVSPSGDAR
jgi:hypothetical protein